MAEGGSDPVRGIRRGGDLFEPELLLHHVAHLILRRVPGPHHGFLDMARRILGNHNLAVRSGE